MEIAHGNAVMLGFASSTQPALASEGAKLEFHFVSFQPTALAQWEALRTCLRSEVSTHAKHDEMTPACAGHDEMTAPRHAPKGASLRRSEIISSFLNASISDREQALI